MSGPYDPAQMVPDEHLMRMLDAKRADLAAQEEGGLTRIATLRHGRDTFVHVVRTPAGTYRVLRYILLGLDWDLRVDARDTDADGALRTLQSTFQ